MPDSKPQAPRVIGGPVLLAIICVAVVVVVAAFITLSVGTGHGPSYERSAYAMLRSLSSAQEQFRAQALVDQDGDKAGEYGWLGELSGREALRGGGEALTTSPMIAAIMGLKGPDGAVIAKGYCYRLYLPDGTGGWIPEPQTIPAAAGKAHADAQEQRWICYAWPHARHVTAKRTYVVSESGDIYATEHTGEPPYFGAGDAPKPDAAMGSDGRLTGGPGRDGNVWQAAGR